jgi:hypothetical protein
MDQYDRFPIRPIRNEPFSKAATGDRFYTKESNMLNAKGRILGISCLLVGGVMACQAPAYQGVAERVGQKLDQVGKGIRNTTLEMTDAVKKKFETVKTDVKRMETQNRVYARLHWDKAFHESNVEVHQIKNGAILLRGLVADAAAKKKAVMLAFDTVGVTEVVDELVFPTPPPEATKAVKPVR